MNPLYRILVVDDNPGDLTLLSEAIQEAGVPIRMTACSDAAQALSRVGDRPAYDLILSDINMPGMNGIELVKALAAMPAANSIPTVLMSSHERSGLPGPRHAELDHMPYFTKPNDWRGFVAFASHLHAALQQCGTSEDMGEELGAYTRPRSA